MRGRVCLSTWAPGHSRTVFQTQPICCLFSRTADTRDAPGGGQSTGIYRSSLGPRQNRPGNPCHRRKPTAGGYSARCGIGSWRPRTCDRWLSAGEKAESVNATLTSTPRPATTEPNEERLYWVIIRHGLECRSSSLGRS